MIQKPIANDQAAIIRRLGADEADKVDAWVERDSGVRPDPGFHAFLSNSLNVCLVSGEGGAIFVWRGPGVYEVHVFLEQRGLEALQLMRTMLDAMRAWFGAKLFWAAVPVGARRVIMFTRLMGWKLDRIADLPGQGECQIFSTEAR